MRKLSNWIPQARLFAVILAAISMSPTIYAQAPGESVEVNVPFAFEGEYQHFPPGLYTIEIESQHFIEIRSTSVSGFVTTLADGERQSSDISKVVFHNYGERHFIREICVDGRSTHTMT